MDVAQLADVLVGFNHQNIERRFDILDLVETRLSKLFQRKQCDLHDCAVVFHECSTHQIGSKILIEKVSESTYHSVATAF